MCGEFYGMDKIDQAIVHKTCMKLEYPYIYYIYFLFKQMSYYNKDIKNKAVRLC